MKNNHNQTEAKLKINYLDFDESEAVTASITKKADKIFQIYDRILNCHVTVSCPHKHRHADRLYRIQIHLHIPGKDIVVSPRSDYDESHRDIYVAITDSFKAAERMLHEQIRIQRHEVKFHEPHEVLKTKEEQGLEEQI